MKKNKPKPPQLAKRFLLRFLRDDLEEEVLGDLDEKFYSIAKYKSVFYAQLNYWYQVINYLRPFAIRRPNSVYLNDYAMFQSYFKIGWRNLLKNTGFSAINIGGLAVGLAVAILNGLWIWDEVSFNKYFENYDQIAQVAVRGDDEEGTWTGTTQTYPLGTSLIENHHDNFKHIVRTSWNGEYILASGDKNFSADGLYADEGAPELFTFKMIYGTRSGLKNTHSILISASVAKAMFGNDDPVNNLITINNKTNVTVTGVYEDFPLNTKFSHVKFFAPWKLFLLEQPWIEERAVNDWRNHFIQIYAEILPSTDFETVSDKIKNAVKADPVDLEKFTKEKRHVLLYPMSSWHLFPFDHGRGGTVDKEPVQMIWLVGTIGGFVLLLACINFMNLSTARSEKRAKEVGIRKTIGSARTQLIQQFFSESYLVVVFAFALAMVLTTLLLPWFNDLAAKQMTMPLTNGMFWLMSVTFLFITGLLAGSYPAFFLSSFEPVKVLKGTFRAGRFASLPRKILVVMQFTISVTLIICTIVVHQQIQFAKNRPVGYNRDGLITMPMKSGDFYGKYDVLRNELKKTGVVEEMSQSMGEVTETRSQNNGFSWNGKEMNQDDNFGTLTVTHEHGKTIGWQFIQGRDFSREHASDSSGMVINEAAAKFMGLQNPVGELVTWKWWADNRKPLTYKILGVISDVVMDSPYEPIRPTVFYIKGHNGDVSWINIRIKSQVSAADALPKIESVFKKIIPAAPFDYKFVDEEYDQKFASEERIGKLATFFGTLAILISCLGLFGLASFVAEQRTKEIGIRKILGASVINLWRMLSKDFLVLVTLSCFIAIPIAYYFLGEWLQKYAYRTEISMWVFVSAGLGAVTITLLTVSYQAINAALMNPVNSLKNE